MRSSELPCDVGGEGERGRLQLLLLASSIPFHIHTETCCRMHIVHIHV